MNADPEQRTAREAGERASWPGQRSRLFPWCIAALVGAALGIRLLVGVLGLPVLLQPDPVGLLRSDPALIYYVTERLVENGGRPPDDFRSDPRIEWPAITDIPAMFSVGQEFLVAWSFLLCGRPLPLHHFALLVMSLVASLSVVGVVGLARELTGSRAWSGLAGLLAVATAANYRTMGSILVREELSLPLLALHLYLLARALRLRSAGAVALTALAAVGALASWHAMSFVFSVEMACGFAWFLRTGENPIGARRGWIFPAVLAAGALAIPVLRSKLLLLSLPMQLLAVGLLMPRLQRFAGRSALRRAVASGLLLALLGLACGGLRSWLAPGLGDYAHVWDMMWAKLRYLGELPADPKEISYDARLLWQGIFETGSPLLLLAFLGALALLAPVAALTSLDAWWHGRGDGREATLLAFGGVALLLALLVQRLLSLAGLLSPVLAVLLLRTSVRDGRRTSWIAGLLLVQGVAFAGALAGYPWNAWYNLDHIRQLASSIRYIQRELPDDAPVAADFVTSSAVLAHTRHPVVLQPKYETARSRARIQRFTTALYEATPEAFREILRREFDARYLLVDRSYLWTVRYEAGLPSDARTPPRGSAAFALLNRDPLAIPGYRLLFESPPSGRFRLYALEDEARR